MPDDLSGGGGGFSPDGASMAAAWPPLSDWRIVHPPELRGNHRGDMERLRAFLLGAPPDLETISDYDQMLRPARNAVDAALVDFQAYGSLRAIVIVGGAGSGKSTALLQSCAAFLKRDLGSVLLGRAAPPPTPPLGVAERWLIAIDDAGLALPDIVNAVATLLKSARRDIRFVIACNFIDWALATTNPQFASNINKLNQLKTLRQFEFRSISDGDAMMVAQNLYNNKLLTRWEARRRTTNIVRDFASLLSKLACGDHPAVKPKPGVTRQESPLLGALLTLPENRRNAARHISDLLAGLGNLPNGEAFRYAFSIVAVAHAYGPPHPDGEALRRILGGSPFNLVHNDADKIIDGLRIEALTRQQDGLLFTRHVAIAEEVCRSLNDAGDRMAELYLNLAHGPAAQVSFSEEGLNLLVMEASPGLAVGGLTAARNAKPDDLQIRLALGLALLNFGDYNQGRIELSVWESSRLWRSEPTPKKYRLLATALGRAASKLNDVNLYCASLYLHVFSLSGAASASGRSSAEQYYNQEAKDAYLALSQTLSLPFVFPNGRIGLGLPELTATTAARAARLERNAPIPGRPSPVEPSLDEHVKELVKLATACGRAPMPWARMLDGQPTEPTLWGVSVPMRNLFAD